jgi:REP element-mobilizing transposase RayT
MKMRHKHTELYLRLVWGTWDRLPLLTPDVQAPLYACIQAECKALGVEVLAIGGITDHVHLLVRIPPTISVAELVKQVKGSSSHLVTHRLPGGGTFKWQGGYGAFTVSTSEVPRIREYILRQEEHHRDRTLEEKYEPPT